MLTHDELQELYEKHCRLCGTQRCTGAFDEFFREECPYYKAAINVNQYIKRGIDVRTLYDEFVKHIDSMTREELLESARKAEEMTAGCNDDWPDNLVEVVRCKDCTWFDHGYCKSFNDDVEPYDFCSRGHVET